MDITILKSRIESCGLEIIDTIIRRDSNSTKLFIEGGPILSIYSGDRLELRGRNLDLLDGVFPNNFEVSRAIYAYKNRAGKSNKVYQILVTTSNPFTCRDVLKMARKLQLKVTMTVRG
jgi:hypothetical protein